MSKYTDGPWTVFIDDSGDEFTGWPLSINARSVHEDCMVVRTGGQWPYKWDHAVSQAEAVANANLMAAAPEMLSSLKEAYAKIDDVISGPDPDMAIANLIDIIDAGIQAYEGRRNER